MKIKASKNIVYQGKLIMKGDEATVEKNAIAYALDNKLASEVSEPKKAAPRAAKKDATEDNTDPAPNAV
jgi:hypothetical protein